MQNNSILIQNLTPEELRESIREIIREQLLTFTQKEANPKYKTRREASTLLKISLPTLDDYTARGIISASRIGTRILYSEEDIIEAIKKIPVQKYRRA